MKTYEKPELIELGEFATLTEGTMGTFNDGGGGGTGMADIDGMGMDGEG